MATEFKRGDPVEWHSEAGRVRGTVLKKVTRAITFQGCRRHASPQEPRYIVKTDQTGDLALHKGSALHKAKRASRYFPSFPVGLLGPGE
jgi:hypothetical protein